MTAAEYRKLGPGGRSRIQVAAPEKRTAYGYRFASALQMRVFLRLLGELKVDEVIMLDARWPLPAILPGGYGRPDYISVDFSILWRGGDRWHLERAIDAKPRAKAARSRDWYRGAKAFAASYGIPVEEVSA